MYARPKRNDSEKDILEMQKAFLSEKNKKNSEFQPAAQVVRIDKGKKQSIFAKTRITKEQKQENVVENQNKSLDMTNIILGDIIEKPTTVVDVEKTNLCNESMLPFPKVEKLEIQQSIPGKSLFALSMERKRHKETGIGKEASEPQIKNLKESFGETSIIIQDSNTAMSVHKENMELLTQMKQEEIMAERAKLLESIDPSLVKFLAQKRKENYVKKNETDEKLFTQKSEIKMDCDSITKAQSYSASKDFSDFAANEFLNENVVGELLSENAAEKWIHFDVIEKEKLEWMKDIPSKISKLKPGESFEARFDWKGVLLPYLEVDENNAQKDDRELYLHGDEPHRPGYTLQELFRLARSSIIQQRISAFTAITGILNIYNQGFYDIVLELPISKIFFLLRFGLDENIPSLLEIVSKGMSTLFYNDTDEIILDLISETSEGYFQPKMELETNTDTDNDDSTESIEKGLKNLKLTSSPFTINVQENEVENKTSMNDFHLAETDLIECLLRTNIVQRISYILGTIKPKNSTVLSCFKILIRIARTNKDLASKIVSNDDLMKLLFKYFLPGLEQTNSKFEEEFYNFPQYLVLRLFRILMCQNMSMYYKILNMNIMDKIKNYLFTREDIKAKLIKVQIESLRIFRTAMKLNPDFNLYRQFLPAFRYMLEWHYQHVIYEQGGSFLIRQHAAALFNSISVGNESFVTRDVKNLLGEGIFICCCKWFYDATRYGIQEFSQSTLLSSCLNCVTWYTQNDDDRFKDFFEKYLKPFILSKSFLSFEQNLCISSILHKQILDRRYIHPALPNLGSVLVDDGSPQLIISQMYPVYFLNSLLKLIEELTIHKRNNDLILSLMEPEIVDILTKYLEEISKKANQNLATNFISKCEVKFVFKLLSLNEIQVLLPKEILLRVTYKILCCMTSEHILEIQALFEWIIFNEKYLLTNQKFLTECKQIYLEAFVIPNLITATEMSLIMPCTKYTILPNDWPYWLIKSLLNDFLQQIAPSRISKDSDFPENEVIRITLTFTNLLQNTGLQITSPTEELMYLMIAFMGQESQFLESKMKSLLFDRITKFYERCKDIKFNFDGKFEGKSKFENLYVLFLDQFQAASYGDDLFSSLVMIPLAQKYDCKWRKMVWSEHASVLRFLNCSENLLLGSIEAYLYPVETDVSLIKCYSQALNSHLLRINSLPYKIAKHHLEHFKKK